MEKSKYEKPVARNLDAVQPVQGSCWSGNTEYDMGPPCVTGDFALQDCTSGGVVLPVVGCTDGSNAGQSCISGFEAG